MAAVEIDRVGDAPATGAAGEPGNGHLSVGVTIDLEWSDKAGGHVKCWERLAEAAPAHAASLDLTLYFLGPEARVIRRAANVHYVLLPPRLGTARFRGLRQGAGDTDLARFHPALAERLDRHDVLHATGSFSLSRTAAAVAARRAIPLVCSVHTDLAALAEHYSREIIARWFGSGGLGRMALDELRLDRLCAAAMRWQAGDLLRGARHVLLPSLADSRRFVPSGLAAELSVLRRGIDKTRFRPRAGAVRALRDRLGVTDEQPIILFVGRADASKRLPLLVRAVRALNEEGLAARLLVVGAGAEIEPARAALGPALSAPGWLDQAELPAIYAGADIFAFPSESEVVSNVVLEAKASGLPAVVANHPGTASLIGESGVDGVIVPAADPAAWAAALRPLVADAALRRRVGYAARAWIEQRWPDWATVFAEDLLPVWRAAHDAARAEPLRRAG